MSCEKKRKISTVKMSGHISLRDKQAIGEVVSVIKSAYPVCEVRLFGSKASGKSSEESDIDLLVLTDRRLSWRERNAMTDSIYDIQIRLNVVVSLLVVPVKEWRSGTISILPIHDEIEEQSIAA